MKLQIPVAFFSYNRPEHAEKSLSALEKCLDFSRFTYYFFSDGPKNCNSIKLVKKVRKILAKKSRIFSAKVIINSTNKGLKNSIIDGVTFLCAKYGWVIVLEDDLIVAPEFLRYMAAALVNYKNKPEVMQIGAYTIASSSNMDTDTFFLPVTTTWGWGTWDRAWKKFSSVPEGWPETLRDKSWLKLFQINGALDYVSMLEDSLAGRNDSWGILWWYAVSRCRGQVLYPRRSLVWNGGFDGSGVHCGNGRGPTWQCSPVETRIFRDNIYFPRDTHHRSADFDLLEQTLLGHSMVPAGLKSRLRSLFRS